MSSDFRSGCPIASTLDLVGDKWSLLILRSMILGARTYGALQQAPERIATNILADRLKRLCAAGIIRRISPRGAYELTDAGADLLPVLQAICRWGEGHLPERWPVSQAFYDLTPAMLKAGVTLARPAH